MTLFNELFCYPALEHILSNESRVKGMLQFEAALAKAEGHHFWFKLRNRLLAGLLRRHFPHARSLLEIGCDTA